jgi:hypothetical protein
MDAQFIWWLMDHQQGAGQHKHPTIALRTLQPCNRVQNPKSSFQMNSQIPSETEVESIGFGAYGTPVYLLLLSRY